MQAKSISETKRVRYLLGLSSPAERAHIESEYFEDDDAFHEMLAAEDDLIDAYARGELVGEERQRFQQSFVNSLRGRDRVQFARAFAGALSDTQPVETKLPTTFFKTFQSPRLFRIAAGIVLVTLLAWLVSDRRRMTNELHELRAESAQLSKRIEALQQSSDNERTRTAEVAAQPSGLRAQPDTPRHRERVTATTQRVRHLPVEKNAPEKFSSSKPYQAEKLISTEDAPPANILETKITQTAILGRKFENLLTLQPRTRDSHVAGSRADQANVTLDGVDVNTSSTDSLIQQNMSRSGEITVRGRAKDLQGKVVSGATVTLTDSAINVSRIRSTNEDGTYIFNAIPPGTYSIEVTAKGFKTALASGLVALANTPTVWDVQLEVGAASETVDVTAAAKAAINTSDATLGNPFESKRITELPLNANNIVGLLSLQPGFNRKGFVNGARADQSNITLDGVDLNTLNTYSLTPRNRSSRDETIIQLPSVLSWVRFQMVFETAAIHEDYRLTIKTADGHPVASVDWIEPLTPNQTIIDTPAISTNDLPPGNYVLLLMGREPNSPFIKVAEYAFKVIKY